MCYSKKLFASLDELSNLRVELCITNYLSSKFKHELCLFCLLGKLALFQTEPQIAHK